MTMIKSGLDCFLRDFPAELRGKRLGVVCHAASITSGYRHITDALAAGPGGATVGAIFGPQHGLFGQTQDNMVEWEGGSSDRAAVPVWSLYGKERKPTPPMLSGLDAIVFDLQDVGARPYTYLWTSNSAWRRVPKRGCLSGCSTGPTPSRPSVLTALCSIRNIFHLSAAPKFLSAIALP